MRKAILSAAIVGIFTFALVAFLLAYRASRPHDSLTVARVALPVVALTHIAEAEGYFDEAGVDVAFTDFPTGREALNSIWSGNQELAIAYTTPVVKDICDGKAPLILTTLHQSERNTAVVAATGRGITTPQELKGKTVGVVMGTSGEFFLHLFLLDNGIEPDEIFPVNIPLSDTPAALKEGRVDAVVTWNPYLQETVRSMPSDEIRVFYSDVYAEISLLVGPPELVAHKGRAIMRFLRALARAEDLFVTDPARARLAASRKAEGAAHVEATSAIWNDFSPGLRLNHILLLTLERDADWMRSKGIVYRSEHSLRQHIEDRFLRELRPNGVTLPETALSRNYGLDAGRSAS